MASIAARLRTKALKSDLLELDFDPKLVQQFVDTPYKVDFAAALLKSHALSSRKPRRGRYTTTCLYKRLSQQLWVIYDPNKHDPILDANTLKLVVRFAIYKPGHPRFLEYNTKTTSLRIRSARLLQGLRIKYTANGPMLAKLAEVESESESEEESSVNGEEEEQEESASLTKQRAISLTSKKTVVLTGEETATSTKEKAVSSTKEKAVSSKGKATSSTKKKATSSTKKKATSSTKEKAAPLARKEAASMSKARATSSTTKKVVSSVKTRSASAVKKEAASSTKEEADSSPKVSDSDSELTDLESDD
ncbi:hypothetical protein E4T47_03054 [Aureobasidium subglaciale]|nr:hypothetical protein E4T47_03054 [Aureobasidium subglaciale]